VDLRAGLDDVEKRKFLTQLGLELQPVASRCTDNPTFQLLWVKLMEAFAKLRPCSALYTTSDLERSFSISADVFLGFLCLEANAVMVPKFRASHSALPDLNLSKSSSIAANTTEM
jgi:hypothetical protein